METVAWPPGKSLKRKAGQSLCGNPPYIADHGADSPGIGKAWVELRVNDDSSVERLRERQEAADANSGVEPNVKAASCSLAAMVGRVWCSVMKSLRDA